VPAGRKSRVRKGRGQHKGKGCKASTAGKACRTQTQTYLRRRECEEKGGKVRERESQKGQLEQGKERGEREKEETKREAGRGEAETREAFQRPYLRPGKAKPAEREKGRGQGKGLHCGRGETEETEKS
jgi:hypothetical protein